MPEQEHDYDLSKKVKIRFKDMDYYVMPRYRDHYLNHEYERMSLQMLKNDLADKTLFVDIGAHYGAYSLYAAKASNSSVIAIEPVDENFSLLNENITANGLSQKVKAFKYAASDEDGEAEFNIPWASDSAGFYDHPNAVTIRKQKVLTRRIDQVIGDREADVIKIDTEGHELGVIAGLSETFKKSPSAKLIIEINPPLLENAGSSAMDLLRTVRDLDKEIYMVDEDEFTMHRITNDLSRWPEFINEGNYANLYCVPKKDHEYLMFISHTAELGGAEMAMVEQIVELRARGMYSHVVLPVTGPLVELLIEKGISHTVTKHEYGFWTAPKSSDEHPEVLAQQNLRNVRAAEEIVEIAQKISPTLILNNTLVNPWGIPAARLLNVPLAWMVHEYGDLDHSINFAYDIDSIRNYIINASDLVICCSESVRQVFTKVTKQANSKVKVVYNLLSEDKIKGLAKVQPQHSYEKKDNLKLCMVGTISEGKGQHLLVEAIDLLQGEGIEVEAILVGTGNKSYITKLKNKVKNMGLEKSVRFSGFEANPYPIIDASDVVVVASRNEAFGRVCAEAMLLQKPVVASNKGGSLEMVQDKVTGITFESGDAEDLARAISEMSQLPAAAKKKMTLEAYKRTSKLLDVERNVTLLANEIQKTTKSNSKFDSRPMVVEWVDAVRIYSDAVGKLEAERDAMRERAEQQEKVNVSLLNSIDELRGSKSFKLVRGIQKSKVIARKVVGRK